MLPRNRLYEVESVGRCTGIRLRKVPDETTILNFRHLPERHGLGKVLFASIKEHLAEQGLRLQEGTFWMPASLRRRHGRRIVKENVILRCSSPGNSVAAYLP